ncbi:Uu.00g103390.m01.CDS01 [Anthostomella pinea]|uniref:Uu.00g103390.m01.CDS01 n=1 Tax=Anthostomella pinea TaxID=933095 RepID=A0AAI8VDE6_9PEZI|nr:Uu.00g103390.m01.CDS01 [Anthostomella pinea]
MDTFALHPSDPSWEEPRWGETHIIRPFNCDHSANVNAGRANADEPWKFTERAKALDEAASKLNYLSASNSPLADVQTFLTEWEDSAANIQPNALAWFNDSNAIRNACTNDSREVVHLLLDKGLQPDALAISCAKKNWKETGDSYLIKLLVDSGWDINEPINDNTPPLMSLSRGADPKASSLSGDTVMQRAASYASLDTLKLLAGHGGSVVDGALVVQASYRHTLGVPGRLELVQYLLDQGAPTNAFYMENRNKAIQSCEAMLMGRQNALHFAIWGGKSDMVKLLLDRGAEQVSTCSAMKTDRHPMSPLELAEKYRVKDNVALLEEAG